MNLADPGELRRFLGRHGISADKSLGQHFLCSQVVVDSIVASAEQLAGILEIGPGPGILTSHLASWDRRLIALEIDARMIGALAESAPYADVRNLDALQANFLELLGQLPEPRGIVGNLPYYITGSLVERIAKAKGAFTVAILMMQREVADRLAATPGMADRGSISVYLQAQFQIDTVALVPPEAFLPPPRVRSAVLRFQVKPAPPENLEAIMRVVRFGFAQPRKTLANNLSSGLRKDRAVVVSRLTELGLRPDVRPHMLTELEWSDLERLL